MRLQLAHTGKNLINLSADDEANEQCTMDHNTEEEKREREECVPVLIADEAETLNSATLKSSVDT